MIRSTGIRQHQYRQLRADKEYTRFSFFPMTVVQWNQLPTDTCLAESLDSFKAQVLSVQPLQTHLILNLLLSLLFSLSVLHSIFTCPSALFFVFFRFSAYFSDSTQLVVRHKLEGRPVYRQKQKKGKKRKENVCACAVICLTCIGMANWDRYLLITGIVALILKPSDRWYVCKPGTTKLYIFLPS